MLRGIAIQEGRAAAGGRAEVFAPGSITWPVDGMGILTRHRTRPVARAIPRREDLGRIVVETPATPAIREAVEAGRRYMSVEFHSLEERTTRGGVREINRAYAVDVALVSDPEYSQTSAEVRRSLGGSFSGYVPIGKRGDCSCAGQGAGDGVDTIEFDAGAFDSVLRRIDGGLNVSAISRGAGDVIADTATGSLVLAATRRGLDITARPLDTEAGRRTVELLDNDVGVYARPIIDFPGSTFEVDGNVARVSDAAFAYVLVKPTHRTEGLTPVRKAPEGRGKGPVEHSRPVRATLDDSSNGGAWWL